MSGADTLAAVQDRVVACRRCPRLVGWRERVAREKRAAFAEDDYWGRAVPAFGDPRGRVMVVGLAPAAHGANRTGRMFTGDRSGDWLFRALHRAGFASQPTGAHRQDGLELRDLWLTASVRCAPPGNRPTPDERRACRPFLEEELAALAPRLRAVVALGGFAWNQVLRIMSDGAWGVARPRPRFGHGVVTRVARPAGAPAVDGAPEALPVLGSYHPSQQNTFTGTLTEEMFDALWGQVRALVEEPNPTSSASPKQRPRPR